MREIFTSKILRKVAILSILVVGLLFVVSSGSGTQSVEAARCCSTCPGGGDPFLAETNCAITCGGDLNPCFDACMDVVDACYATCRISC